MHLCPLLKKITREALVWWRICVFKRRPKEPRLLSLSEWRPGKEFKCLSSLFWGVNNREDVKDTSMLPCRYKLFLGYFNLKWEEFFESLDEWNPVSKSAPYIWAQVLDLWVQARPLIGVKAYLNSVVFFFLFLLLNFWMASCLFCELWLYLWHIFQREAVSCHF